MGVNRTLTIDLIAPIPASSAGQALTFPRRRGKALWVTQRSAAAGGRGDVVGMGRKSPPNALDYPLGRLYNAIYVLRKRNAELDT